MSDIQSDFTSGKCDDGHHGDTPAAADHPSTNPSKHEEAYSTISVRIDGNGNLVFDGYNIEDYFDHSKNQDDYEHVLSVESKHKDSILLYLMKDRFRNASDFCEWLDTKGIGDIFQLSTIPTQKQPLRNPNDTIQRTDS
jgi:hypothetical protein